MKVEPLLFPPPHGVSVEVDGRVYRWLSDTWDHPDLHGWCLVTGIIRRDGGYMEHNIAGHRQVENELVQEVLTARWRASKVK